MLVTRYRDRLAIAVVAAVAVVAAAAVFTTFSVSALLKLLVALVGLVLAGFKAAAADAAAGEKVIIATEGAGASVAEI